MTTFKKIYNIISFIPKGKVSTYGTVAKLAKIKNPRIVGFALHKNKNPEKIPCHRIVKSNGRLATGYVFGGLRIQKEKLKKEGIRFLSKYIVDLTDINQLYK